MEQTSIDFKTRKYVVLNIKGTKNNTFLHVTDLSEQETLFIKKGGDVTKKDREKDTTKSAEKLFNLFKEVVAETGFTHFKLKLRNKGSMYRKSLTTAVRHLEDLITRYYNVTLRIDNNPEIYGYMRPKKVRRV